MCAVIVKVLDGPVIVEVPFLGVFKAKVFIPASAFVRFFVEEVTELPISISSSSVATFLGVIGVLLPVLLDQSFV